MADNYWTALSNAARDNALPKEVVRGEELAWTESYRSSKTEAEPRSQHLDDRRKK